MASATPSCEPLATLLVLDALRPVRQALRQVFEDLDEVAADSLERQLRWCGSAAVYAGSPADARLHAGRLEALGLTTSVNLRLVPAAAPDPDQRSAPD